MAIPTLVCDIEDYDMTHIEKPQDKLTAHVFFMATYGEGEPTDNSESFYDYIMCSTGRVECDGSSAPIEFTLNHLVTNPLNH